MLDKVHSLIIVINHQMGGNDQQRKEIRENSPIILKNEIKIFIYHKTLINIVGV